MRKSSIVLALSALSAAGCGSTQTRSSASLFETGLTARHMAVDGEQHERMSQLVGDWSTTSTFWDSPSQRAGLESHGSCTYAWNEEGGLLHGRHAGELMGTTFEGSSVLGYDELAGGYVSAWADAAGELVHPLQLACCQDDDGGFQVERTTEGGSMRETLTMQGDDSHVLEMHRTGADGQEWCMLRVVYTRR